MGLNFRSEDRDQGLLFPPSVADWVPEDHEARFVREIVLELDRTKALGAFYASYNQEGRGGAAYSVVTMLSVLVYAYSNGICSSRRIARALEDSVAFRFLAANQKIDFRTIASFRKRHLNAFLSLFSEILKLCRNAGLVSLGRVAIDGRRVKANACKDKSVTEETLDKEIEALAKEILEGAEKVDAEEDDDLGDRRGDELPKGFSSKVERKERLEEARRVIQAREARILAAHEEKLKAHEAHEEKTGEKKRGPKPKAPDPSKSKNNKASPKANTTDPASRLMKTRGGFIQGYNAQVAVDGAHQIVVAQDVCQDTVDTFQLEPMLKEVQAELGQLPRQAVADAGYWSPENADLEEDLGVEVFIAVKKDSKQRTAIKRETAPKGRAPRNRSHRERMERKLLTKRGKEAYRSRGHTCLLYTSDAADEN